MIRGLRQLKIMMDSRIYSLYKPLRNYLRPVAIENAFYVIWAYITYLQFDRPIPKDVQVHESLIHNKALPGRQIFEWELALLAREIIVHGQKDMTSATKSFQVWDSLAGAINKLKEFENNVWPILGNQTNVLKEFRRIAHRQFPWQSRPNSSSFLRYFKIYNNPRIKGVIENKIGITVQQWYTIGTALAGAILNHPKFNLSQDISISTVSKRDFYIFLSFTATNLDTIRKIIERDVNYDDEFVYTLNPLEYYPLVSIGPYYYCPIITFLFWRITSGIYFDLVKDKAFGHPFGLAFQDYLEEVSRMVLDPNITKVFFEQKYTVGRKEEDSIDLILSQSDAAVFVEAKTKRMQVRSKSQLLSDAAMEKDLNVLADDIVQTYATIDDYTKGLYSHFPYQPSIKVYPLIVTLEDWFLFGEDTKTLLEKVKRELQRRSLPANFLENHPYTVCSTQNFEYFVQVLNNHSINKVMDDWFTPDKEGYNFGQFLLTNYRGDYKNIGDFFPGDFEKIYPVPIKK